MPINWSDECSLLQCVDCRGALQPAAEGNLACVSCRRLYPVRDGILDAGRPVEGSNRITADFYDGPQWQRFRFWEKVFFLAHGGERRARMRVMRYLPELSGTKLLDVGIGEGGNLPLIPSSCDVYGLDVSLAQLRECLTVHRDRRLRLARGEAEKLPFRDHVFDNVMSTGGFNHFTDPLGSLHEMARVVKPGGVIVVADEVPEMPERMLRRRFGRRVLHRWFGREFADVMEQRMGLKVESIVRDVLVGWTMHSIWRRRGYCVVGRAPAGRT